MKLPNLPLKRGAIVSCYFPLNEDPDRPGPSARPALILGAFANPQDKSQKMVIIAYGTSRKTRANLGYEIRIESEEDMQAACLHRPTRFTLNRLRILPLTKEFFDFNADGTPVIGIIPEQECGKLNAYLNKLATHADELNFFRPKEAMAKGLRFDHEQIDSFMKTKMTGLQRIPNQGRPGRRLYRRG